MPLLYRSERSKSYKFGIIPHACEFDSVSKKVEELKVPVKIIDLRSSDVEEVINNICGCGYILSSSLYGIIIAQSYSIPALFFQHTHKGEGLFKYNDYFSSVNIEPYTPFEFSDIIPEINEVSNLFDQNYKKSLIRTDLIQMQKKLIHAAPFCLREKFSGEKLEEEFINERAYLNSL